VAYYIRILSPSERIPSIEQLTAALSKEKLAGTLTLESGTDADWTRIVLAHENGPEIAVIERNSSSSTDLVSGEIEEFIQEIADCKPPSAAAWLTKYLPTVRTIYAFQLLSGTDHKNGCHILGETKNSIFAQVGGVIQADGEGFSNEDGYHILWQFSDSVKGTWWMGILRGDHWVHFQMDLGNKQHREAFFRGEVPEGAKMAE
jgi:hypothetical protein